MLNDQILQKSSEIAALTAKLEYENAESARKLSEAEQRYKNLASEATEKLKELTAEADQKIVQANQPEVQARVTFRKALLSSGNVAKIENLSSSIIAITAQVERPGIEKTKSFEVTLDINQSKEIGEREGWAFIAGDIITVIQPEHKTRVIRLE